MPKGATPERLATMRAAAAARQRVAARIEAGRKVCSRCQEEKDLTGGFSPCQGAPDGHDAWCRACRATLALARWHRRRKLAAIAAAERFTPLTGWVLTCCGGQLANDRDIGWWRALHQPGCRNPWQPTAPLDTAWVDVAGMPPKLRNGGSDNGEK